MSTPRKLIHGLLVAIVIAAALNILILLARGGSYDTRVGPLHLVAHGIFKPLLILTGAFLLALLFGQPRESAPLSGVCATAPVVLAILAALSISFSVTINSLDDEWNYRRLSATYRTLGDVAHLFVSAQVGLWYRPFGFASLWLDQVLFNQHVWAYHLQNILLHFANALLVSLLARRLGLTQTAARWAGALYLTAAIAFEPVIWPSARFDLWAMLFTLLASIASLRFLSGDGPARKWLPPALVCYALGVCSKESAYAFPVLLALAMLTQTCERRRLLFLGAGVVSVTALMLAIRLAVLGGAGGYGTNAATPSIHFSFTLATLRIVLARAMQMSLLTVNLSHPMPAVMLLAIGAFALLLAFGVVAGASTTPRQRLLAAYALAATLPVAPMVSWLDGSAQEVRYLYMPAAFVMMLAAAGLSNARRPAALLFAFGLLNLGCGVYNSWVYTVTYRHAAELARGIEDDFSGQPAPMQVKILGMPNEIDGVLYSTIEVRHRLQERFPAATVNFEGRGVCSDPQCYVWQPEQRTLRRFSDR